MTDKNHYKLEIIEEMCGSVYPYGSSNIDDKRLENLEFRVELISVLLDGIIECRALKNRSEYSILKMANKADEYLKCLYEQLSEIYGEE